MLQDHVVNARNQSTQYRRGHDCHHTIILTAHDTRELLYATAVSSFTFRLMGAAGNKVSNWYKTLGEVASRYKIM